MAMDKYGIIGFPLGHSFSRGFFTEKFAREGIDAQYLNFEIPDLPFLASATLILAVAFVVTQVAL